MLQIRRMGPQIGVEITGVDVKTMDEATWSKIYQAWLDRNVMVVRDQDLTIPDFIAYSERFGPVTPHPSKSTRHPDHPKITMLGINKFDAEGKLRDEIYRRVPRAGTPTVPITRRRSRQLSSTHWRCRVAAATRCLPMPIAPTTCCRSG
jgi:alpha-ketoglutarate-dependent taurine dioxygenase